MKQIFSLSRCIIHTYIQAIQKDTYIYSSSPKTKQNKTINKTKQNKTAQLLEFSHSYIPCLRTSGLNFDTDFSHISHLCLHLLIDYLYKKILQIVDTSLVPRLNPRITRQAIVKCLNTQPSSMHLIQDHFAVLVLLFFQYSK